MINKLKSLLRPIYMPLIFFFRTKIASRHFGVTIKKGGARFYEFSSHRKAARISTSQFGYATTISEQFEVNANAVLPDVIDGKIL